MSWPGTLGVGILTGIVTGLLAGVVANLAAGWYRMSNFEGAAGYFVVGMALLGAIIGIILGVIISRTLGSWTAPSFLKALGASHVIVLILLGTIGATARLLADVPPRLGGQTMLLAIELRWPEGQQPAAPPDGSEWFVRLSRVTGNVARASAEGPLWRGDARQEDGRWIVPGAVDLFTSRGTRMLTVSPDDLVGEGFIVPLPGRPGPGHLDWSAWLPNRQGSARTRRFEYRFRVVPADQPIRSDTVGPFTIALVASALDMSSWDGGPPRWTATGKLHIRHRGQPVTVEPPDSAFEGFDAVAVVSTDPAALAAQWNGRHAGGPCLLLVDENPHLRTEEIGQCGLAARGSYLPTASEASPTSWYAPVPTGRLDREGYATPGHYLLPEVVLDTRTLSARRYDRSELGEVIDRVPPLGIAPDGLSLVRLAWTGSDEETELLVVDLDGAAPIHLPIDRALMRYAEIDQVDAPWLRHYFEWRRDADGRDRLTRRPGVVPLPHRGVLTLDGTGYREFRLRPARESLRPALVDWLVAEFGAERLAADPAAYAHEVRIGESIVFVGYSSNDDHVGVWMSHGQDTRLVATIAERFNQALGTLAYDRHFSP